MPVSALIRVRPAVELRREFAGWAVAQTPKLRTVSESEFGVPADLFPAVPEELLVGALIDGQPYVPPAPEPVTGAPEPPGDDPGDDPEGDGTGGDGTAREDGPEPFVCGVCGRGFGTERGRDAHRRQAHSDEPRE